MEQRKEDYLERPLPSNEDAEQTVLGTILIVEHFIEIAVRHLVPDDFYSPFNRRVFDAMKQLHLSDRTISPAMIHEVWKSEGVDVANSPLLGIGRIADLSHGLPFTNAKGMEDHCIQVKKHAVARALILSASTAIEDLLQGTTPVEQIVEKHESKVLSLNTKLVSGDTTRDEKPFSFVSEIVPQMKKQFEDYHNNISNGVPSGMPKLDEKLDGGGFQDGGVYLVAAGEKAGKTSMALDWVDHASIQLGLGTSLIATGEMSKITMGKRLYSAYMGIPYYRFRPGMYDAPGDPTYSKAMQGLDRFSNIPVAISDNLFTIMQIKRQFGRMIEAGLKSNDPKKKVILGVVDYLQLFTMGDGANRPRTQEVEKVSRELKMLAMELGIPIIAMSSVNRLNQTSGEANVLDSYNLRDAQSLAFDCEALFFIHNPAYIPGKPYESKPITPMNLILSRQRNGPTGTIPVVFIGPYMQFMTAEQYEKNKAAAQAQDHNAEIPLSQGQLLQAQQEIEDLWK